MNLSYIDILVGKLLCFHWENKQGKSTLKSLMQHPLLKLLTIEQIFVLPTEHDLVLGPRSIVTWEDRLDSHLLLVNKTLLLEASITMN